MQRFAILSTILLTLLLAETVQWTVTMTRFVADLQISDARSGSIYDDDRVKKNMTERFVRLGILRGLKILAGIAVALALWRWPNQWLLFILCGFAAFMAAPTGLKLAITLRDSLWPTAEPSGSTHVHPFEWGFFLRLVLRFAGFGTILAAGIIRWFRDRREQDVSSVPAQ